MKFRKLFEALEDERDLLFAASDYKCKLTHYDMEEAADWNMLLEYIKEVYHILMEEFGDNIKMWKFYEDDDSDLINGYKVWLNDGTKHIVEINNDRVDIVEGLELKEEDEPIKFIIIAVDNDGNRLFYNAESNTFVDSHTDATIYDEHDDAIDAWHKIDKKQYKRVFVPNYNPAMFEAVNKPLNEVVDNDIQVPDEPFNVEEAAASVYEQATDIYKGSEINAYTLSEVAKHYFDFSPDEINKLTDYWAAEEMYKTDYRYYVYNDNDEVVSDSFEYDEDAIEWAVENGYPVVKIHNYFYDEYDKIRPDGYPEVIWTAE